MTISTPSSSLLLLFFRFGPSSSSSPSSSSPSSSSSSSPYHHAGRRPSILSSTVPPNLSCRSLTSRESRNPHRTSASIPVWRGVPSRSASSAACTGARSVEHMYPAAR